MRISNAQRLADLIRAFVAGKPMSETIKMADGSAVPLAEWLTASGGSAVRSNAAMFSQVGQVISRTVVPPEVAR